LISVQVNFKINLIVKNRHILALQPISSTVLFDRLSNRTLKRRQPNFSLIDYLSIIWFTYFLAARKSQITCFISSSDHDLCHYMYTFSPVDFLTVKLNSRRPLIQVSKRSMNRTNLFVINFIIELINWIKNFTIELFCHTKANYHCECNKNT